MLKLYVSLQNMLADITRKEEGQTAVEYGLVLALIAVVVVTAVATGLTKSGGIIDQVLGKVDAAV